MKVLVVIPAYNEALNLEKVVKDIKENSNYDYIIINDCSKDNTEELCNKNNFNYISLPINYGLASAIQIGMKYAMKNNYDAVVQFDGDGQHEAKYIKKLIDEINNSTDIAIGSRFVEKRKNHSIRMLGSRIISLCIKITTGQTIKDPTSGMRAFNKECIKELIVNMNLPPEPDTLVYMMKNGMKVKEVQVEMKDREQGESYFNAWKSIEYMMNVCVSIIFVHAFRRKKKK